MARTRNAAKVNASDASARWKLTDEIIQTSRDKSTPDTQAQSRSISACYSPLAQVNTQKRCAVVLESKAGYGPRTQISHRALLQPERSLCYVSVPQFLVG